MLERRTPYRLQQWTTANSTTYDIPAGFDIIRLHNEYRQDTELQQSPPSLDLTKLFVGRATEVVDRLLDLDRHRHVWTATKPFGDRTYQLVLVCVQLADLLARTMLRAAVVPAENDNGNVSPFLTCHLRVCFRSELLNYHWHDWTLSFPSTIGNGDARERRFFAALDEQSNGASASDLSLAPTSSMTGWLTTRES